MNTEDNTPLDAEVNDAALPIDGTVETTANDPAAEPEGEGEAEQPKPKAKTAQDRINDLTRARREAERDAEYWRAKALQGSAPEAKPAPTSDGRPDPATFAAGEYDPAYIEQLTDWKAEQAVTKVLGAQQKQDAETTRAQSFNERVKAASEKLEDFDDVVFGGARAGTWVCTNDMLEAIQETEKGPEVAYHLATNPAEAQRIAGLSPRAQAIEIGKLEARLTTPDKPKPKTASDAPAPIGQVRGANGTFKVAPDTADFAAFERQFGG